MVLTIALDHLLPLNLDCDFAILPALIGAAGVIGGALLSGNSQSSANSTNMAINQMNNAFNEKEARRAREFQLQMWNRENEYNTASAQRQRLSEAGLNPYLMMDGSSAGVAGSTGSTSQAQSAQPLQVNPVDYSSFANTLARSAEMSYQQQQSNAMVSNLQGQKDLAFAQANQIFSNIDWGKLTPEYKKWMRETGVVRAQLNYDTDKQNLDNLRWTNKIQRAERVSLMLSNDSKKILNKYLDQSEQLRLNVAASQYYDMMAAGHLKYQQCKESIAKQILMQKQGIWYDSMSDRNRLDYKNALALADDYIAAMSTSYESQTSYNMGFGQNAQEAGRRDAESKSFKSLMDRWNYNKRFYEEGLNTIRAVGNAIGSIRR